MASFGVEQVGCIVEVVDSHASILVVQVSSTDEPLVASMVIDSDSMVVEHMVMAAETDLVEVCTDTVTVDKMFLIGLKVILESQH